MLDVSDDARNHRLVDAWSFVHLASGVLLALVLPRFWALVVLLLWEPLEILVLSPLLARVGVRFGHESLRNSMMDIVFDVAGVLVASYAVLPAWDPLGVAG